MTESDSEVGLGSKQDFWIFVVQILFPPILLDVYGFPNWCYCSGSQVESKKNLWGPKGVFERSEFANFDQPTPITNVKSPSSSTENWLKWTSGFFSRCWSVGTYCTFKTHQPSRPQYVKSKYVVTFLRKCKSDYMHCVIISQVITERAYYSKPLPDMISSYIIQY